MVETRRRLRLLHHRGAGAAAGGGPGARTAAAGTQRLLRGESYWGAIHRLQSIIADWG